MKKHLLISFCVFVFIVNTKAQSNTETVLETIAKNNKTILANVQYCEVQKLQYKTGLNPNNPTVNYDYLIGSPNTAGDQTDFTIAQSFDFPTAYIKKKQVSDQQISQVEFQLIFVRQDVLLEAKKTCFELVFRNKLQLQLSERKRNTEKLLSDFQSRLTNGEGTILDINKARLQLIEINKEFQQNISLINQLNQKLTGLNGGNVIVFADTIYPITPNIPAFEQLSAEIETSDPIRKFMEQEKLITQKKLELSKAMRLPKLEAGYHYQGILGQTFQGVHAGITIPLWENKNTVKTQQANLVFSDLNMEDHRNTYHYEIKQLYEKHTNLKIVLEQYQNIFSTFNNTALLNKSISLGQISTIEYFMEMSYYNNAFNNYLQTEKELYEVIAELYKYQL